MNKKTLCKLFEFTEKTLYNWTKEKRPVIKLIEKYFSESEIEEFIANEKIEKLEQIQKLLPSIRIERDIYLSLRKLDNLKNIEQEEEIRNEKTVFADFIMYVNNSEYKENLETLKYYYLTDKTFANKFQKTELIKENDIPIDIVINFLADINNDLQKTIEIIKKDSKYTILYYLIDFIAPILDMKYNNKIDYYEKDFTDHICKIYNLPSTDEMGYIEEHRNDIKKEMIVNAIDSYLYKIKRTSKLV